MCVRVEISRRMDQRLVCVGYEQGALKDENVGSCAVWVDPGQLVTLQRIKLLYQAILFLSH